MLARAKHAPASKIRVFPCHLRGHLFGSRVVGCDDGRDGVDGSLVHAQDGLLLYQLDVFKTVCSAAGPWLPNSTSCGKFIPVFVFYIY